MAVLVKLLVGNFHMTVLVKVRNSGLDHIRGTIARDIIICTMSKNLEIRWSADWFHFGINGLFIFLISL